MLGKTRKELLDQMGDGEISWWLAVDRVMPLPDTYWQSGLIASTIANVHSKKQYQPQDFMPKVNTPKKPQTQTEQKAVLDSMAARQRR